MAAKAHSTTASKPYRRNRKATALMRNTAFRANADLELIQCLADEIARIMTECHAEEYRVHVDHQNGLVMIAARPHAYKPPIARPMSGGLV